MRRVQLIKQIRGTNLEPGSKEKIERLLRTVLTLAISKHKQGAGERIFRQLALAKRGKPIDAVTEVDRLAGKEDPELRDELNH